MWNSVYELYKQTRKEYHNDAEIGIRSLKGMRNRYKRLNFLVNKWVGCYSKVVNRPPASGTNIEDDIQLAQKLFRSENNNKEFVEFHVYNTIMSKHAKWKLQKNPIDVGENISWSGSKTSRPEMDSSPASVNVSTPSSVNVPTPSSLNVEGYERPEGREAAKKKRQGKAPMTESDSVFSPGDISVMEGNRLSTKEQVEFRQKRMAADFKIEELRIQGWATFVKSINAPQIQKHRLFAARQESCRKDVERAFGVLQARFAFIKHPCLLWDPVMMGKVLLACIIMHNMIVEDERETYLNYESIIEEFKEDNPSSATDDQYEYHRRRRSTQERFVEIHGEIRDHATHNALKNDFIEHIWENFRN
ncbi:uncharacterized protein LOC141632775 [Silene latifolia]|uniref:uncharacterized protein LOC141632775 n=1 Tax=Silene latifolia TaxID=37657 RepID=UPI003D772A0E